MGAKTVTTPIKGRGTACKKSGRFETLSYEPFDDGWMGEEGPHIEESAEDKAEDNAEETTKAPASSTQDMQTNQTLGKNKLWHVRLRSGGLRSGGLRSWGLRSGGSRRSGKTVQTQLGIDVARSVLTRNTSPDVPFDRSINPYKGCEHGCVYCFARPTHAYLGLSPGLDFETKLFYKPNAAEILRRELSRPSYTPRPIALGTNTDPYQPVERQTKLTRQILEVLVAFNHPFTIVTKSTLVIRDLDLIAPMAEKNMARVTLSITSLDNRLSHLLEPRAAAPAKRINCLRDLTEAGIPCGVLAAPMIPALNDPEIEAIAEAVADAGATSLGYVLLRLPLEIKELFSEWLRTHRPDRAARILSLVQQTRDGKLNDAEFGSRMRGQGPIADLIAQRFAKARKRYGFTDGRERGGLDCTQFANPDTARQLTLL